MKPMPLCGAFSTAGVLTQPLGRRRLLWGGVLLLSACTTLTPPAAPVALAPVVAPDAVWQALGPKLAEQATTAADAATLAAWWQQFDDADLNLLVRSALAHNHEVQIAQASVRQAQAARQAVAAGAGPQLGSSASVGRNHSQQHNSSSYQLGLSGRWQADWNGSAAAGVAAADAELLAASADLGSSQMLLTAELGLNYVQWRDAQARQALTQASATSLADTLTLTGWRVQAGLDSPLALEQARLALSQTRASLPSLATAIAQYEHQLALLSGMPLHTLRQRLAQQASMPQDHAALQQLRLGLPADVLRRRPDLRSAEAAVWAQWAHSEHTRRSGWPTVSLSGSLGWQALSLAALGGPGSAVAALSAGIDWTLWDGGQRRALVAREQAVLAASQLRYQAAVNQALKEVEDALVSLQGQLARTDALAHAAQAADAVFRLTQQQHQAGLLGLAEVLSAQRNALNADIGLQSSRTERSLALIRLFKALGGGWSPPADPPAQPPPTVPAADHAG